MSFPVSTTSDRGGEEPGINCGRYAVMDPDAVIYPDQIYKVRGSLVMWALHKKAHDAFLIWILAQDFARASNRGKPSGRVHGRHLVDQLIRDMKCNATTAKRRLSRAIRLGFIEEEVEGYYLITGRNRMAETALRLQSVDFDEKKSTYRPIFFFLDDREYSVRATNLVDPENLNRTKALLYKIAAVYGSRHLLSRDTHAKLIGNGRDAILKISKRAGLQEVGTYLLIDPMNILYKPTCSKLEAIEAFKSAESLYRYGCEKRVRGRELLHRKRVDELDATFLSVQLPNTFTSETIEKEVPVKFNTFAALLGPGEGESRTFAPDRQEMSPGGRRKYLNSRELAGCVSLSDSFVNRYLTTIRQVLDEPECRESILRATGAEDIRPLMAASAQVWRGKAFVRNNTPEKSIVERSRFSSLPSSH